MKVIFAIALLFCLAVRGQTTNGQVRIEGLFGIKLGEPLPASCTNSHALFAGPDEWGFQAVFVEPPTTNSEFNDGSYIVTLTPTNRMVCVIEAANVDDITSETFSGVRNALRQRYGKEDANKSVRLTNYESACWSKNGRTLELVHSSQSTSIKCQDDSLAWHPAHATDTKGL